MIHLSYEQEITLIKRLVMAQGVSEEDAASLTGCPVCASICASIWPARLWPSPTSAV